MTTYRTGNPIGSTDSRDRLDNTENMDYLENSTTKLTHADRLGTVRKTRHGMEVEHDAQISAHETEHDNQIANHESEHDAQISAHENEHYVQMRSFENDFDARLVGMAFTRIGSFTAGATLTDMRQVLIWEISKGGDGHEYGWTGIFPKVVSDASTPATSGGIGAGAWVDRTNLTLRDEICETVFQNMKRSYAEAGFNLVDGSFQLGGELSGSSDVLWDWASGKGYQWHLDEAKTVATGSVPTNIGTDWIDKSDRFKRCFYNVQEMKLALTADDIGKTVEWFGFYSASDSGGNTGIVVSGQPNTEDNFKYFNCDSGVQVVALFQDGQYTLTRAGVIADGTTDNTTAITNADAHVKSISKKLLINGSGLIKYSSLTLTSDLIPDSGIFDVTNSNMIDISGKISLSRNQMFDITGLTPSDHNTEFPVKIRSRRCQPEWFGAKTVLDHDLIKTVPDSTSFIMASLRAVACELDLTDIVYDTSYTNYINKERGTVLLDAADYRVDGHILLGTTNDSLFYKYWFTGIGIQGLDGAMELTRLIRTDLDTTDKLLTFQFLTNEPHTIKNFKIIGYNPDAVAKYTSKAKSLFELITGNAAICSNLWIAGAQYDQGTGLDGVGIFVANMAEVTFDNVMAEQNQVNWSISRSVVNLNNCFSYFAYRSLFELGASLSGWTSNNTSGITIVNGSNLVFRNNSPLGITNKAYDARINLSNVVLEAKDETGAIVGDYAIYAYSNSNLSGSITGLQVDGFLDGLIKTQGEGSFGVNSKLSLSGVACRNTGTTFTTIAGLIDTSTNTTNLANISVKGLMIKGLNNLVVRGRYAHISVNDVDFYNLIGGGNTSGDSLFSITSCDKGEFKNWNRSGNITTVNQTGYIGAGDLLVDRIAMSSVGKGITGAGSTYKYTTVAYS